VNTFVLRTTARSASPTRSRRVRTVAIWVARIGLGAQFVMGGAAKLAGDAQMVAMFDDIGAGQWFRLVVGVLEIAGGIGLLVPRLSRLAAAGLVALMIGAAITNVGVLGTAPTLPLVFGALAGALALVRR
jgi:putative oxidoreductase